MTDILRHSEGIWRSIYIFAEGNKQYPIKLWFVEVMKKLNLTEFSWCHYGEKKCKDSRYAEKEHITFRICFPTPETYGEFLNELNTTEYEFEDHGYDEELWVKKAYVLGTRMYQMIMKETNHPDVPLSDNFLRLMFHGFCNDAHYGYRNEMKTLFYMWKSLAEMLTGVELK